MAILTKDAILGAQDLKKETVKVPEWGGEVLMSTMTGAARDEWERSLAGDGKKFNIANVSARLISYCAVNEKGERLFSEGDAEALGRKSAKALKRLSMVAQRLNALTDADLEEARGN